MSTLQELYYKIVLPSTWRETHPAETTRDFGGPISALLPVPSHCSKAIAECSVCKGRIVPFVGASALTTRSGCRRQIMYIPTVNHQRNLARTSQWPRGDHKLILLKGDEQAHCNAIDFGWLQNGMYRLHTKVINWLSRCISHDKSMGFKLNCTFAP